MATPLIPEDIVLPEHCATMAEVRAGVDALDRHLVQLMAMRQGYMEAAARIKPSKTHVIDPWRMEDVVTKVLASSRQHDLNPQIAEPVWREIIARCTAHEMARFEENSDQNHR